MDSLSLLELNALVRRSLEQCLPDEYWIQAELSDVRSNTTGHCYLEFVQKDPRSNNLVAKARGMIWSNIYRLLKPYFEETTGQLFASLPIRWAIWPAAVVRYSCNSKKKEY